MKFFAGAAGFLFSSTLLAASFTYDFTYNGSTVTTNASAAGSVLNIGDNVQATFRAEGDDYWQASAGAFIWTPIVVQDSGSRAGDLFWQFSLDGTVVQTGSLLDIATACCHVPSHFIVASSIAFDELFWTYAHEASTATQNVLGALIPSQFPVSGTTDYIPVAIPEPESYAMLAAGLGLLALMVRRRRKEALV